MELARSVCVLNALNPSELLGTPCNDPVQRKIDFGDGDPRGPHSQRLDGVRRKPRRSRQRMMFLQRLELSSAGPSPASITRAVRASCGAHGSVLRPVRRAFDLSCWMVELTGARCCINGVALRFAPGDCGGGDRRNRPAGTNLASSVVGRRLWLWVAHELLSMCARNSAIEPNLTVPSGSLASIEPSA
jgi:hypothetical protein